jgi:enoyl-CoA hydratase/carnithine racemase
MFDTNAPDQNIANGRCRSGASEGPILTSRTIPHPALRPGTELGDAIARPSTIGRVTDEELLRVEQRGPVRWLVIDRADKRNAMTSAMGARLGVLLDEAAADDDTRVVVITGAGSSFSSGFDVGEIKGGMADKSEFPVETLVPYAKPTIACMRGMAFGGGATMAMACDLRIAAPDVRFTFGLGRYGLTPEWGSSYLMWRQIGWSRTLDLFLTGRPVDADEALRIGLVDRIVDDAALLDETQAVAEQIASLPAGTAEAMKAVLRRGLDADFPTARQAEKDALAQRTRALRAARRAERERVNEQ